MLYTQGGYFGAGTIFTSLMGGVFVMLKWLLRVLPFAYMVLIWTLSSMPADAVVELPDSRWDGWVKESMHLVEFAILYVLLVLALLTVRGLTPRLNLACILFASLYGLSDEIHQYFVPARSATLIDLVKDVIGVLVASWMTTSAYQKKRFQGLGRLLRRIGAKSGA
jgi:VanZ family protein